MSSLKLITEDEREAVVRMAAEFVNSSPSGKYGVDEEELHNLVSSFIADRQEKTCLILVVDDKPVGVLAALSTKNIFNKYKVCGELIWWIDPAYRQFKNAKLMLDAYEYWAKDVQHAQIMQLVTLDDSLDKLYTRRGFSRSELAYTKDLQ